MGNDCAFPGIELKSWQTLIALKNQSRLDEAFLQYSLVLGLPIAWGKCKHTLHLWEGNSMLSLALQNTSVPDLPLCQTLLAFPNRRWSVFFSETSTQTPGFHSGVGMETRGLCCGSCANNHPGDTYRQFTSLLLSACLERLVSKLSPSIS